VVPASCQQARGQPVASSPDAGRRVEQAIGTAADQARKQVFTRATQRTLWFNTGVFLVSFMLSLLLPATPAAGTPTRPATRHHARLTRGGAAPMPSPPPTPISPLPQRRPGVP
jgi:hypothetical protein